MPSSSLWSRTHCRPASTSEVRPPPVSSSTRTETRLAAGAMPARRPSREWLPLPTMMPATCVPWPFGSMLARLGEVGSSGRSKTGVGFGFPTKSTDATSVWMSGWGATPESSMAIVTPAPFSRLSGAVGGGSFAA